jgi:response regulator RpfG family c-di-GMP phosphodiesterase
MALKYKHRLLLVDDEESITKALYRLFRKEGYEIYTASSGQEALGVLKEAEKRFSLIISDQRMPGMTGVQFLEKAKKIFPDAIRILLTGYSDMDAIVDAVNKGEIHRYLTKPWNDDDLLIQIRQALEQYELRVENVRLLALTRKKNMELKELNEQLEEKVAERSREIIEKNKDLEGINKKLEKSFLNAIRLLSSLIETLNPELGEHMRRVATIAREIAEEYGLDRKELDQIEMAAMLHDIGLLGLSEGILKKDENDMSERESYMFRQHPEIGQICLQPMGNLDRVGAIILSHHEHYDGSGFPGGLKGEEIPIGARIIGVVADYCKIVKTWPTDVKGIIAKARKYIGPSANNISGTDPKNLINDTAKRILLVHATQKYDPDVVMKLVKRLEPDETDKKREQKEKEILSIHFDDLKEGMVLAKSLCITDGRPLLLIGTALNESLISTIHRLWKENVIEGPMYVKNPAAKELNGK